MISYLNQSSLRRRGRKMLPVGVKICTRKGMGRVTVNMIQTSTSFLGLRDRCQ